MRPRQGLIYTVLLFLLLFLSLIVIEIVLMAVVSGTLPNQIISTFIEYLTSSANTAPNNWVSRVQNLWSSPVIIVSHQDRNFGIDLWTIVYFPITLMVYLLALSLAGYSLAFEKQTIRKVQTCVALLMLTMSVTYIYMIEYYAEPTWVFQVPFLVKNSVVYHPKIYWVMLTNDSKIWINAAQWILAILGLVWLIGLVVSKDKVPS